MVRFNLPASSRKQLLPAVRRRTMKAAPGEELCEISTSTQKEKEQQEVLATQRILHCNLRNFLRRTTGDHS
eukprot:symbB.v1.2.008605.t1/scaffold541.1/size189716/1